MLTRDNIIEIAYHTDYLTTVDLLKSFDSFETDAFWEQKWTKMYPNTTYNQCLSIQDCFLMQERKNFVFVFGGSQCCECGFSTLHKNFI